MGPTTTLLISFLLLTALIPPSSQSQQQDQPFTSIQISQKGLNFIKTILITKAINYAIPLHLPIIQKSIKVPFLGSADVVLSNVTIYEIGVNSSYVKVGDSGIAIIASKTTCNLSLSWKYVYSSWLFPGDVSDKGKAFVQALSDVGLLQKVAVNICHVKGMDIGLTLGLENDQGTLKLNLLDSGCYVKSISIKLDGGASWLYQGMIDAFQKQIRSAVENAITQNLNEGILQLDSFLQSLPKAIPVDDYASLNVTFLNQPLLSNSFIGFDINGLFRARVKASTNKRLYKKSLSSVLCTDKSKMLGITLDEEVFNSASALYYDAEFMQWIVDKIPDQSLLNTAGWRFIIPQLYKKYPNDDMNLNITLSSPPIIKITERNIDATLYVDLTIDVLEEDQVIPVACISLVIRGSGSVKISGNNLAGNVKLNDFTMSQNWSDIGNLHLHLIQPIMRTIIQTVVLPLANAHLSKGFPLPVINGFTLEDGEVICSDSKVTVCTDVSYSDSLILMPTSRPHPIETFVM
ncbi:hypothetical protein ACFE04_030032 [Oxalis oulophora]